jgi:hypothetical protein
MRKGLRKSAGLGVLYATGCVKLDVVRHFRATENRNKINIKIEINYVETSF